MYDAIVVGLGPAGSSAAYEIARAGRAVLALERDQFPRYKVCGGGLSARVDALLGGAHRDVVERTVSGITFRYQGQEPFTVSDHESVASFVMRDRFDAVLADRAATAGASVRYGEAVLDIDETAEYLRVRTATGTYRTRFLVGADGAHSLVAKRLNPRPIRGVQALEAEIAVPTPPTEVVLEMGAVPGGYGWTFPKGRGVSIGIGGFRAADPHPKALFARFAALQPGLRSLVITKPLGHPIPVYTCGVRTASSRIGLVGDAAHLADPFFGEGIYYGILSGQRLGRTVVRQLQAGSADLSAYARWIHAELAPEFEAASRLASLAYGYPRLWYEAMRAHPDVVSWFYHVLQGKLSFQGLWARLKRHAVRLAPAALAGRVAAVFGR